MKTSLYRLRKRLSGNSNTYRFADFCFDAQRLHLRAQGRAISLRPKTASVLKALLEAEGSIVNKRALMTQVWHSEHVQDQSLFQAVSELRSQLAPRDWIKTHPNLGYQWVGTVHRGNAMFSVAVAVVLFGFGLLVVGANHWNNLSVTQGVEQRVAAPSPAMRAYEVGLSLLNANRAKEAEGYFELAVRENPQFLEARLMSSEALFAQGQIEKARSQAQSLMEHSQARGDSYVAVSALGLLSRADQELGKRDAALQWALTATRQARSLGFACAAVDLRQRLIEISKTPADARKIDEAETNPPVDLTNQLANLSELPTPDYCDDISPAMQDSGANLQGLPYVPRHCNTRRKPSVA